MVGDGSYLMMAQEILTSIQEGYKLTIILLNNHGFSSIGGLSEAAGSGGFGTEYRYRNEESARLDGDYLPVDFAANAVSLGAHAIKATDLPSLKAALAEAFECDRTTVIVIEVDREQRVPIYESWWDVPVAEVSAMESVRQTREGYEITKRLERHFLY